MNRFLCAVGFLSL